MASLPRYNRSETRKYLCSSTFIIPIKHAEIKKVKASIKNAVFMPYFSTITPPNPNPSIVATIAVVETKELAIKISFLLSTREGIIAILEGIKNLPMQKERKINRYTKTNE